MLKIKELLIFILEIDDLVYIPDHQFQVRRLIFTKKLYVGKFAERAILLLSRHGIALSPRPNPPFRLHQVDQNIVDAGQVPFAFGTQPIAFPEQCLCRPADSLTRRLADLQIITFHRRTISIDSLSGNRGQTVVEWWKRLSGYRKALALRPVYTGRDPHPHPPPIPPGGI